VSFSAEEKAPAWPGAADEFGIAYIEGGWPGSNPKDMRFFELARKVKIQKRHALPPSGSTRRAHTPPCECPNVQALLEAQTPTVTIFGKQLGLSRQGDPEGLHEGKPRHDRRDGRLSEIERKRRSSTTPSISLTAIGQIPAMHSRPSRQPSPTEPRMIAALRHQRGDAPLGNRAGGRRGGCPGPERETGHPHPQ